MLTKTINESDLLRKLNLPANIEPVEYSPEFIAELRHTAEITKIQVANGEDKSIRTLAKKLGFDFDNYEP